MAQLNSLVVTGNSRFISDTNVHRINSEYNIAAYNFRTGSESYNCTIAYETSGNEAMVFATQNAVTSFMFVNGENSIANASNTRWASLTPGLQIKNNCVSIGKLIANGVTPSYKLEVNGTGYFSNNLTATKFIGPLEGNATSATSATKATQDSDGNAINTTYLKKSGGTITGALILNGDLQLKPASSSSNDSPDISWHYGNGQEKSRLWTADTYNSIKGLNYRVYKSDGTLLRTTSLPIFTADPTSGQVVITDGTACGIKSSGYTIATSVPSGAVFTDTKVTSTANHYTPATVSGQDKTASASGATAAWGIDVVKGVTLNTDGKGHVTGISVTSGKIPNNPDTDTKVTQTATTTDANYEVLFSATADNTTRTEGARKTTTLRFNPSKGALMEGDSTAASGNQSHAEGYYTAASGNQSHAEGNYTTASGVASHAEGYNTKASGAEAHAEGGATNATNSYTHAEGYGSTASGQYSHASGQYTCAVGTAQTVVGKYNVADTTSLFIVGNGTSSARSNALCVNSDNTTTLGASGSIASGNTKAVNGGTVYSFVTGGSARDNTKLPLAGGTLTGRVTTTKPINDIVTGTGTTAQDKGSGVSPRYFPAKWTYNTGQAVTNGDIIVVKLPCAGHDYGVFISIDNGTTYKPVAVGMTGTSRLTTHFGNGAYVAFIYDSSGTVNSVYPVAGGDSKVNVSGGCWRVFNYYDTGNTYDRNRFNASIKAWGTKIIAGNIIVGTGGLYHHLKEGTAFDITYPILYLNGDCNASSTTTNTYDIINFTITTTQSITLTAYKPVYIKGTLSGTTFTPVSTTPLTQTVPTSADNYYYMFLGNATSTTAVYLTERHEIYAYKNGKFGVIVNDALSVNGYTVAKSVPSDAVFTDASVTASGNHYTPATVSGQDKTASASGATAAWSIDVVKGVTLNTDGKGHVTGISVTSGKIPGNPNTDTKVTQTADDSTDSDSYEVLFSGSANNTTATEGAKKSSRLKINPKYGRVISGGPLIVEADNAVGAYDEGIRINRGKGGYATLHIGGADGSTTGTGASQWWIGCNPGSTARKLWIAQNGSTTSTTYFGSDADGTVSPYLNLGTSGSIASGNTRAVTGGAVYTFVTGGSARDNTKIPTSEKGKTVMEVGKESSRSTSTQGTWTAMCNPTQTGSPTLPSSAWYNVINLNNWTNSSTNWVSQLAICTQQDQTGVWWRCNNSEDTDISSSTWYNLIDTRSFESVLSSKITMGNGDSVSSDGSLLFIKSDYGSESTNLQISPYQGFVYADFNSQTHFWAIHSGNAYTTGAQRNGASVTTNGFYWINTNAPSPANNDVFAPDGTVMMIASAYNENWVDEIAQDSYNHGVLLTRSKQNGAWTNWYNTYYGCKWTCYVVCGSWRRLFISNVKYGVEGQSGILSISTTRNNVVLNATFLITVNHHSPGYYSCRQIGCSNYQSGGYVKIRVFSDTQANFYVEIYDTLAGHTSNWATYYHCSYLALLDSNDIITYTTAPEGGALDGYASSAEVELNSAAQWSHAEGFGTCATGNYSHAEGYRTSAGGGNSHAEGQNTRAGGHTSHAEGSATTAGSSDNVAAAHAEGTETKALGKSSHTEGENTVANLTSWYGHAEGYKTTAFSSGSHAEGAFTSATCQYALAMGHYNVASSSSGGYSNTLGTALAIGNGTSASALSNAFSVQFNGVVKAASTITASTTADYAEYFEWRDQNLNNEDRVGYFVTFDSEDKIRIANNEDDYILGIVSGEPFVLGNGDCDVWNGMVMRDKFRRIIYEPAPAYENINGGGQIPKLDKYGKQIYDGIKPKYNPNYDPSRPYINRADRPEWAPIGMLGVIAVRDDGTCEVNKYCTVNENGIATKWYQGALTKYRVIRRNDVDVVEVVFR